MKKASRRKANGLRPEYDFRRMKSGVRGKYVRAFRAGTNLILLDADVAEAFPTSEAVNDTLRAALSVASAIGETAKLPNKRLQRSARPKRSARKATPRRPRRR